MKIYTKTGDDGQTALYGGGRVSKHAVRVDAFGTVDELNASLGLVRSANPPDEVESLLQIAQNALFDLGAELATPKPDDRGTATLDEQDVAILERAIDLLEGELTPLTQFILPGGSEAAARLHLARGICRRAERRVVSLSREEDVRRVTIQFLNRLGDYLFVAARYANSAVGCPDVPWQKRCERAKESQ